MYRRLLVGISSFILSCTVMAQEINRAEVLEALIKRLEAIDTLDATYDLHDSNEKQAGTTNQPPRVIFQRPGRMSAMIAGTEMISDGTTVTIKAATGRSEHNEYIQMKFSDLASGEVERNIFSASLLMLFPDAAGLIMPASINQLSNIVYDAKAIIVEEPFDHHPCWKISNSTTNPIVSLHINRWWDQNLGLIRKATIAAEINHRNTHTTNESTILLLDAIINKPVSEEVFAFTAGSNDVVHTSVEAYMESRVSARAPFTLLNQPAPDFSIETLGGSTFTLSEQTGKVVVIDFWATWCPPCVKAMPEVEKLAAMFEDDEVTFIGLSTDEPTESSAVKALRDKLRITYPLAIVTNNIDQAYSVQGIPVLFIVDREGVLRWRKVGYSPTMQEELHAIIHKILKGEELPQPEEPLRRTKKPFMYRNPDRMDTNEMDVVWLAANLTGASVNNYAESNLRISPRTYVIPSIEEAVVLDADRGRMLHRIPLDQLPRRQNSDISRFYFLQHPDKPTLVTKIQWKKRMPEHINSYMVTGTEFVGLNTDGSIRWANEAAYSNEHIHSEMVIPIDNETDVLFFATPDQRVLLDVYGHVINSMTSRLHRLEIININTNQQLDMLSPTDPYGRMLWPKKTVAPEEQP